MCFNSGSHVLLTQNPNQLTYLQSSPKPLDYEDSNMQIDQNHISHSTPNSFQGPSGLQTRSACNSQSLYPTLTSSPLLQPTHSQLAQASHPPQGFSESLTPFSHTTSLPQDPYSTLYMIPKSCIWIIYMSLPY